jgi:predicted glutamine amidotransferase
MGYVSSSEISLEEIAGDSFPEFTALSSKHCDGWGIASVDSHEDRNHLVVEAFQASKSLAFKKLVSEQRSDGALLHLRWATSGLAVKEGNTHPFTSGKYSFIHNGGVVPAESLDPFIKPEFLQQARGETDSEKYFFLILTEIEKFGEVQGIQSALRIITSKLYFSSLNAMILTPDTFYVISEYDHERRPKGEPADYYELYYQEKEHGILVASSGWDQRNWNPLSNHVLMEIDRESLTIVRHPTVVS